jgi:ABC-2 type transport system permease protein
MRAALIIAGRILRQRLRDRSAIVFAIVTPLGLAVAFSFLIPNDFTDYHTHFVVVNQDGGHVAQTFVDDALGSVVDAGVADVSESTSEAEAADQVRAGEAGVAIVIPPGFSDAVQTGTPTQITLVKGDYAVAFEIARSVASQFADTVGSVQLMVATTAATGGSVDQATVAEAQAAMSEAGPIASTNATTELLQANLATFYGAAMAIMFVFFATQYGSLALLSDVEQGTMARLLAAPVRPASIIFGASIAGFALGLVSMTVLWVATTVLVGASWGSPPLVAALILAAVIAAMGISALVATIARTPSQAGGLNAIVALSLAALGGVFIPLSQAPESLVVISQITPHYWFLRGINSLAASTTGLVDILPSILVLVGMGVVLGGIGLVRAARALVR